MAQHNSNIKEGVISNMRYIRFSANNFGSKGIKGWSAAKSRKAHCRLAVWRLAGQPGKVAGRPPGGRRPPVAWRADWRTNWPACRPVASQLPAGWPGGRPAGQLAGWPADGQPGRNVRPPGGCLLAGLLAAGRLLDGRWPPAARPASRPPAAAGRLAVRWPSASQSAAVGEMTLP